jgi:hypothetical protein
VNPFAADLAAILRDGLAVDAVYTPDAGLGTPFAIRTLRATPDATVNFGGARLASATAVFSVATADVAAPVEGDLITSGGSDYRVQGTPLRDARQLRWTIEAYPL